MYLTRDENKYLYMLINQIVNSPKAELFKCLGYRARDVDSSGGGEGKKIKKIINKKVKNTEIKNLLNSYYDFR